MAEESCIRIIKIDKQKLTFKPGETSAQFEVTVKNNCDRYASLQLEVEAAGAESDRSPDWYTISPEVGTKNPPGDNTQFQVEITDTPVPGFVGRMNLTILASSTDLPDEDRAVLHLTIEQGTLLRPLILKLPKEDFKGYPGDEITVSVEIYNPNQQRINARLSILELESTWSHKPDSLSLDPGKKDLKTLSLTIANNPPALGKVYPLIIEATHANAAPAQVEGNLEVLPQGFLDFSCEPKQHKIPAKLSWAFWRSPPVTYNLKFNNASNVHQQIGVRIQGEDQQKCNTLTVIPANAEPEPEKLIQTDIELPSGEKTERSLVAASSRPWLGLAKRLKLDVEAIWSQQEYLNTRNENQDIELILKPIIPLWLLISGGIFLLFLVLWFLLNPSTKHKSAVKSVQFNGVGDKMISASDDQTLISWRVDGFKSPWIHPKIRKIGDAGKAVRVIRYRPVNNNLVVAGLENGEIQLWDLLAKSKQAKETFVARNDDRVLALEFTDDSRYLFSGYGSGLVRRWDIKYDQSFSDKKEKQLGFVVSALKLIGEDNQSLAIAGRRNNFKVWNYSNTKEKLRPVNYPPGNKDDYIESLDKAESKPYLVATADNQGYITLWNLKNCIKGNDNPCGEELDRWSNGHGEQPVRTVALSANGCYLASGGDDGRMILWPLTASGSRDLNFSNGIELHKSRKSQAIYSIDVKVVKNHVLVASGSKDTWVRVKQTKRLTDLGCDVNL
ncbi:MAG: hypothetical protein F6K10_17795 [Moorea sp. SIO2B7]|nr:hypothetical protein [Moorena sp. SIO2B7]